MRFGVESSAAAAAPSRLKAAAPIAIRINVIMVTPKKRIILRSLSLNYFDDFECVIVKMTGILGRYLADSKQYCKVRLIVFLGQMSSANIFKNDRDLRCGRQYGWHRGIY